MIRFATVSKCLGLTSACAQRLLFSTFQPVNSMYTPKGRPMKARNKTIPRKVNLSRKLREEFAKHKGKSPIIKCRKMEFNFFEGMKYGKFETVPVCSKSWFNRHSNGDYFTLYENYMPPNDLHFGHVRLPRSNLPDVNDKNDMSPQFEMLGIDEHHIESLKKMGITIPADIQIAAIPHILQRKHCVVSAHTGCGKTLAYLLPLVQMVLESVKQETRCEHSSPKAIILTPSRELAYQIFNILQNLVNGLQLSTKLLVGGFSGTSKEVSYLPEFFDIVVGSLGTVHKSIRKGELNLQHVQHIVLDEADQLVDDQNRRLVRKILRSAPVKRMMSEDVQIEPGYDSYGAQMLLVSATIPLNLEDLFEDVLDVESLERISTSHLHNVLKNAPQLFLKVSKLDKGKTLLDLIEKDHKLNRPVLIFSNKVMTADWVSRQLNDWGYPCKCLTSSVPTAIRQHLFERFQEGEFNYLSTTTMAARGLDTVRVKHIINFEFPLYASEYLHQIGRVGRIGSSSSCHITNIITHTREVELVQKIELSVRLNQKLHAVNANIPGILTHRSERREEREAWSDIV